MPEHNNLPADRSPHDPDDAFPTLSMSPAHIEQQKTSVSNPVEFPRISGYQITGRLGEGGMGVVWSGTQLSTKRKVAIKFLSAASFGSVNAKARFTREVELAASLQHPHIARVYDSGLDKGVFYYAMELVEGIPLDQFVRRFKFTTPQILKIMARVCFALQFAHQKGVIHRDLKPSNILVSKDGQPHILDFGLAKNLTTDPGNSQVSIQGDISGTPAFMSPEQATGEVDRIDARADIYSLGAILYLLLTRKHAHDLSGSTLAVLRRIVEEEPIPPRQAKPDLDQELEAVLLKALARERESRYGTARELAEDLRHYLAGDPISASRATTFYFLKKRFRKHQGKVLAVAIAAAVLLVTGIVAATLVHKERRRTEEIAAAEQRNQNLSRQEIDKAGQEVKSAKDAQEAAGKKATEAQAAADKKAAEAKAAAESAAEEAQKKLAEAQQSAEQDRQRAALNEGLAGVSRALEILREKPNDPDACLAVGRFQSFITGDWDAGVPLLSHGSDATLQALAKGELARPATAADQLALADGWWAQSLKETGINAANIRSHAATWYEFTAPHQSGEARARADERAVEVPWKNSISKPLDLVQMLDLTRDAPAGKWSETTERHSVANDAGADAKLEIPYVPPPVYDLRISVARTSGNGDIGFIFVAANKPMVLEIGANQNSASGFLGRNGEETPTTQRAGVAPLVNNLTSMCLIRVRKAGIQAFIDGNLVDEAVDLRELRPSDTWNLRRNDLLGVAIKRASTFDIYSAEVVELGSAGNIVPHGSPVAAPAAAALVHPVGPILALWHLDSAYTDASGNGCVLSPTNNPIFATGHLNNGLQLNGRDQFAGTVGSVINTLKPFSVAAWVNWNGNTGYNTAVSEDGKNFSAFYLQFREDTKRFSFTMPAADTISAVSNPNVTTAQWKTAPATNTWYHLAGVYDGTYIKLYVNGARVATSQFTRPFAASGSIVVGGARNAGRRADFWHGLIDEVGLFSVALTDVEVASLYKNKFPATAPTTARGAAATQNAATKVSTDRGIGGL